MVTFGYLSSDWFIYPTRDHAGGRDRSSAIYVGDTDSGAIASSGCMNHYVRVEGTLGKYSEGYLSFRSVSKVFVSPTETRSGGYFCYKADP